jgi:riboflavin-specific deaminase-like protein
VNPKLETRNSKLKPRNLKLPFIFINMAITADGKIATANRSISSFGSKRDKKHMFELRATADAVIAGARTVESAPITMGPGLAKFRRMRTRHGLTEYNLRIVTTRSGNLNPKAKIFKKRFSPVIVLVSDRASDASLRQLQTVTEHVKSFGKEDIDFRKAFQWLRKEWGVKRLLCEGGGDLNDALFRAGMVNELHLTICPKIFGGRTAPTIAEGTGVLKLADAAQLKLKSMKRVGDELFVVYECLSSTQRARSQSKSARRFK